MPRMDQRKPSRSNPVLRSQTPARNVKPKPVHYTISQDCTRGNTATSKLAILKNRETRSHASLRGGMTENPRDQQKRPTDVKTGLPSKRKKLNKLNLDEHTIPSEEPIVEDGWVTRRNFQASYGLKMDDDDMEEGDAILEAMRKADLASYG